MAWKMLLEGGDGDPARGRVGEILDALAGAKLDHPGVAGGKAGVALFHAAAARAGLGRAERADELLGEAIDDVAAVVLGASLYSGFSGVAWVMEHLAEEGSDDGNEDIDAALLDHLAPAPWRLDYDVINGLAGFGVYALERVLRRGSPSGAALLERIVDRLAEIAVEMPGSPGVTWWTPPDLMLPDTAARSPLGNYNLGVAHGMPGVIALLGATVGAGVAEGRARPLLERAVAWLLAQRLDTEGARFGYTVEIPPADAPGKTRAGWCYGDPGIAAALLWAGQCAGESRWIAEATDLARGVARRPAETCGVVDAGLCHGAAGLALLFNRMWQATGDEELAAAARAWARRTVEMHRPGEGVAGYPAWGPVAEGRLGWTEDAGVLTGAAGVGLALLACVTTDEPSWDRFLLTSPRPR